MTDGTLTRTPHRFYAQTRDDQPLVAHRFEPADNTTVRGAVLVVPAMATPARYYAPFAHWLAGEGFVVYTFDYRGYGESATMPLRQVRADILDWAQDVRTILDQVRGETARLPLTWVGHSLGGQLLPLARHERLDKAVIVASGTGHWRHAEGSHRVLAPALWYAIAPTLTSLCGYFPGRRIRLLGDLPAPVMRQWAAWCRNRDYVFGVHPEFTEYYSAVKVPVASVSFTDDETMSATATADLESRYTSGSLTPHRYRPAELGVDRVGHFGAFRRGAEAIWERVLLPHIATSRAS